MIPRLVLAMAALGLLALVVAANLGDGMAQCQQRHSFNACAAALLR